MIEFKETENECEISVTYVYGDFAHKKDFIFTFEIIEEYLLLFNDNKFYDFCSTIIYGYYDECKHFCKDDYEADLKEISNYIDSKWKK